MVCLLPYTGAQLCMKDCVIWLTGSILRSRPISAVISTCAITQPKQDPDISQLDPKLQQQWDHDKNAHLGTIIVQPGSSRVVSWRCTECPDGYPHEWKAPVSRRTSNNGCPFCKGRRVCKHNSLATQATDIAASWDAAANIGTPHDYTAHSSHRAQWMCPTCKHKWSALIQRHVSFSSGCPQCYNARRSLSNLTRPTFAACNHPLLGHWDHEANVRDGLYPEKIRLRSHKLVHWVCHKCPRGCLHKYQATPNDRTGKGSGCPYCSGNKACKCNSLQSLFPDIAQEWDDEQNEGTPDDCTSQSGCSVWWKSAEHGSWHQKIRARTDSRLKKHQKQT